MKNAIMFSVISLSLTACLSSPVSTPPASSVPVEETVVLISEIQTLLNKKGYKAGPPDGVAGPKTRDAIRKFEKDSGLPVDGLADDALYAALKQSDVKPVLSPNDRNTPSGEGMLGVRIESANAAGVTLKRVFFSNDSNNLRIADEHCAKYGKAAQFVSRENDRRRYNCVK